MPFATFPWKRPGTAAVAALLLALPLLVTPSYLGDTFRYSVEIAEHRAGRDAPYWEFGHLLWRPWGNLGVTLFGGSFAAWFGDTETLAAARFLIATSWLAAAAGVLLLALLLEKRLPWWAAAAAAGACAGTNALLTYSQSGTPYTTGFACTALAMFVLAGQGRRRAETAGAVFALAVCVWFPYAFVGLGILACAWWWTPAGGRWAAVARTLAAMAVVTLGIYGLALWRNGFHSLADIRHWIAQSDNGWNQTINLVRAITGMPRGWLDLGTDTVILKRWFFNDPYNPAGLGQIAGSVSWKLAAFYTGMAGLGWGLWRHRTAPEWRWIAAAGFLPLWGFAVSLFEPSSAERFLPAFPFLFAGLGVVLAGRGTPAALAAILPLAAMLGNLHALSGGQSRREAAAARLQAVPAGGNGARVVLLNLRDEIYQHANVSIFDRRLNDQRRPFVDLIETGSIRAPHWKRELARHARQAWEEGREVWISERVWAERPAAEWLWVEGDDPSVRWKELPAFFAGVETDQRVWDGRDGFRRLARGEANRALLDTLGR